MIDARRMEVFTALYDFHLNIINDYAALDLDAQFLEEEKEIYQIIVGGNGSFKLKSLIDSKNILYPAINPDANAFAILAHKAFVQQKFADVAYSEPFYLKPVYIRSKK